MDIRESESPIVKVVSPSGNFLTIFFLKSSRAHWSLLGRARAVSLPSGTILHCAIATPT